MNQKFTTTGVTALERMNFKMQTRMIEQVLIYKLVLNPFGRAEECTIAALSTEYMNLVNFYHSQVCESFRDEQGFVHSFKEGPLHFLNPCASLEVNHTDSWGHGISTEWVNSDSLGRLKQRFMFV